MAGIVEERLAQLIASDGPISVARYMAEANAHYYDTRDPFGTAGDFTTAPEISQMFGELIGLWLADLWVRAGSPDNCRYVELGPGRGTLAADALRAMASAGLKPGVDFVETSPVLRAAQTERVPDAHWHDDLSTLPANGPLLAVANEFFDALPIRQMIRTHAGWCERRVDHDGERFVPVEGPPATDAVLHDATEGTIIEASPAREQAVRELAARIAAQGGAAIVFDYGHLRTTAGDTLQAVSQHRYADPWQQPGTRDLTAQVDFEALATAAQAAGVRVHPPCEQGGWLKALGIDQRVAMLARAAPDRGDELAAARERLAGDAQMGRLFKVMALSHPDWPQPAGFA
jgi:SAM-dependent MidA family methyltransferase